MENGQSSAPNGKSTSGESIASSRPRRRTARQSEPKQRTRKTKSKKSKKSVKKPKICRFEGFCWWCTNPKPTLKCASTCARYFHPHCLEQYLRGDLQPGVLDETTGQVGKSVVNWNDSDDDSRNRRRLPRTMDERNQRNLLRFGQDSDDEKDREESAVSETSKQSTDHSDVASERDISIAPNRKCSHLMDVDGGVEADDEREQTEENATGKKQLVVFGTSSSDSATESKEIEQRHAPPFPENADPKQFLQELAATWRNDHVQTFFTCLQCHLNEHTCFICDKRKDDEDVVPCIEEDCGHFYHMSCLSEDKWSSLFYMAEQGLVCPRHRCCSEFCTYYSHPLPSSASNGKTAKRGGRKKRRRVVRKKELLRQCWYCPRAYHRNCVPPKVELPAMDLRMTTDDNVKQPDYVFDLIICREHPSSQDGLFGRNDAASNVLALNFSTFGALEDVFIGLPSTKVFDPYEYLRPRFEERQLKISVACPTVSNPYEPGFKELTANKWVAPAKKPKWSKKLLDSPDYMKCECKTNCEYDSCYNAISNIECFDEICNLETCKNRRFANSDPTNWPIVVKQTPAKGRGTFAARDLQPNELVVEYVGEVLTVQEADRRLEEMNKNGAPNFYFMSMSKKLTIDATYAGNVGRFLNHSCAPNCRCDLWDVKGVPRLGIFTNFAITAGTELTYDYKYEVKNPDPQGRGLQQCMCGAPNCRIYLGFSRKQAHNFRIAHPEMVPQYESEEEKDSSVDTTDCGSDEVEKMDVDESEEQPNEEDDDNPIASDVEMNDAAEDKENADSNSRRRRKRQKRRTR